jgi:hypothetical protein
MQVVELGEQLCHLIAFGHVLSDCFAAGVIIDMSIGVDDLHIVSLQVSLNLGQGSERFARATGFCTSISKDALNVTISTPPRSASRDVFR